jgi:hypothetical protein
MLALPTLVLPTLVLPTLVQKIQCKVGRKND